MKVTNASAIATAVEFLAGTEFPQSNPEEFAKLQHIDEVNRKNKKPSSITPETIAETEKFVLAQPIAQTAKQVADEFGWTVQRASMTLRASDCASAEVHNGKSKVKVYGTEEQIDAAKEHYMAICQAKAAERASKAGSR